MATERSNWLVAFHYALADALCTQNPDRGTQNTELRSLTFRFSVGRFAPSSQFGRELRSFFARNEERKASILLSPIRRFSDSPFRGGATSVPDIRHPVPGFTLIELLVVIAVIAVLVAILLPSLSRAREAGRRAACLGNLRQMQVAWQVYSDDYGGYIVNGQPWDHPLSPHRNVGIPWMSGSSGYPAAQSQAQAEGLMRNGALARYVGNVRVYQCPARVRDMDDWPWPGWQYSSSYGIVGPMNVWAAYIWSDWDRQIRAKYEVGRTVLFVRKTSELVSPGPASRMVFLDNGSAWGQWWGAWGGWDGGWGAGAGGNWAWGWNMGWSYWGAPIHHSDGTCMSFADGHAEYRKWIDPRTVKCSKAWLEYWHALVAVIARNDPDSAPYSPVTGAGGDDNDDFVRLHTEIWGKPPRVPFK